MRVLTYRTQVQRFANAAKWYRRHRDLAASTPSPTERLGHQLQAQSFLDTCRAARAMQSWQLKIGAQ